MAQTIHLNGGPWHGRTVAVEDGHDHFHIIEPAEEMLGRAIAEASQDSDETFAVIRTREGMYSQVQGRPGEYEWDGWRSHD